MPPIGDLFSDERVERTARPDDAGRSGARHVEVDERQSDLASVVGLDRPRARQAAAAGRLRHQVRQVPDVPPAAVGRRRRDGDSARKRATGARLLD